MNLLGGRARLVSMTAHRTMGAYGALREARGRLSSKRSRRALAVAGGTGLVAGLAGGFALGARFAGGCAHDLHDRRDAELSAASATEQAASVENGALAP